MQLQTAIHKQNISEAYSKDLWGEAGENTLYTSWCGQPTVNHTLTLLQ